MRRLIGLVVIATLAFAGLSTAGGPKKDLDALQGTWKVLSIKESAKDKNPPDEFVKSLEVNIKGDVMKIMSKGDAIVTFKLKVDQTKSPKHIDFTHTDPQDPDKGKTDLGIYKLEGDTLTFCNDDPGKARPTVFAPKEGTTISMIVMKKSK